MGNPNAKVTEEMLCSLAADYLASLRNSLMEISQLLQDKLFEMDTEEKQTAGETVQNILKTLK